MQRIPNLNIRSHQAWLDQERKKLAFYQTLEKAFRIAIPLLSLSLLTTFGLLNPLSLPVSSTLLFIAYAPCLDVTVGTFEAWSEEVRREIDKHQEIQKGLGAGKDIFQAWIDAIPDHPLPTGQDVEAEVRNHPNDDKKREELWKFRKRRALCRLENGRRKVERAYIAYVERNQRNYQPLSSFGVYKKWRLEFLMDDHPFVVFITTNKREFTSNDDYRGIFTT